jgi:hypothetical protein
VVLLDPLGVVLESLSNYFEPTFLAFTLVIGYLWFFLFFFKTKHWDDLGWGERFFFGLIIGAFLVFILALIELPFMIALIAIYTEEAVDIVSYLVPIGTILFLAFLRDGLQAPLASIKAYNYLSRLLEKHRTYWPYLLLIFSVVTYFGIGWNNVFFSETTRYLWLGFIILMNFSFCLGYFCVVTLVTQLSCSYSKKYRMDLLGIVFKFCFFSFWKSTKKEYRLRKITRNQGKKVSFFRNKLINNDFLHKALIIGFMSAVLVMADGAFHLVSPSIPLVETQYTDDRIEVFRYYGEEIVYTVKVSKTYWVNLPFILVRNLNLSIPNPSNFSIYDRSKRLSWGKQHYGMDIEVGTSLAYSLKTDKKGEIESINVMPINTSQNNQQSFITLSYRDKIDLDLITTTEPRQESLANGSILVTASVIISNTQPTRLRSEDFAIMRVEDYGNLTSLELFQNGTKNPSPWYFVKDGWLWISLSVNPYSSQNLTISTIFEEAAE